MTVMMPSSACGAGRRPGALAHALCVVLCTSLASGACAATALAQSFFENDYLVTGSVECTKSVGDADLLIGARTCFLVAITADRGLVGWTFNNNGAAGEDFRFVASNLPAPVGIRLLSKTSNNLLESQGRDLQYVVLNHKAAVSTRAERLDAIEVAPFQDYPFALFFSSSYLGVDTGEVGALVRSGTNEAESTSVCGVLAVTKGDGGSLREIRFSQKADDELSARLPGKRLRDYESPFFDGGLVGVTYKAEFQPPLAARPTVPWLVLCSCERVGKNGHVTRAEYRAAVTKALFERTSVDHEIDAILRLIPEGEEVQSSGPIEYVWERENVVRRVDSEAVARARWLLFATGRSSLLLPLLAAGILAAGAAAVHCYRRVKEGT